MNRNRRNVLQAGGGAGLLALLSAAGFVFPDTANSAERNKAAFDGKTLQEAFKALGVSAPESSDSIVMKAPDIAENGAVVPIAIESRIPGTESIVLLVEKNPTPLAAIFAIPSGTESSITTRVKMGETSNVHALVKANGKFFSIKKEIKVTLGGCGG